MPLKHQRSSSGFSDRKFQILRVCAAVSALGLVMGATACIIQSPGTPSDQGGVGSGSLPIPSSGEVGTLPAPEKMPGPDRTQVDAFLDGWHHAASVADEVRYFGGMTPDGVFVGTDKKERWTRQEFIDAFQEKHFVGKEEAWTYYPQSRNVHFATGGSLAWFDEKLLSKAGFHVRGSGVVQRQADGQWKVAHYVMSFPVPNEVAKEVLDIITEHEKAEDGGGETTGDATADSTADSTGSATE